MALFRSAAAAVRHFRAAMKAELLRDPTVILFERVPEEAGLAQGAPAGRR